MGTGTKIALLVGGIAVVSVGTYFIMKSVKKAKEKKEAEKKAAEEMATKNAVGFPETKNPMRLIPNTQPLGFGAQKGGLNNLSLYDKDAFKQSMNQFPKTYDPNFLAKYDPNYVPKYDPNFLLNRKPLTFKPISTI